MTAVSSLVYPDSRLLPGWWRQLPGLHPRALWWGYLLLHRVEALARLQQPYRLNGFPQFILRALALTAGGGLDGIDDKLHLGRPLLHQLLRQLQEEGLVQGGEAGTWWITTSGQHALRQGSYARTTQERRVFYFVESEQAGRPPEFLNLRNPPVLTPCQPGSDWHFDIQLLQSSLRQSPEWKRHRGFPLEIEQILGLSGDSSTESSWKNVILDEPQRLFAILVLTTVGNDGERLLGFGVQEGAWLLRSAEPAFVLQGNGQDVFPDLAATASLALWQQAWRDWCQPRGLPPAEADACTLDHQAHRLRVHASRRLLERLRALRSEALKGEVWLQAGAGRLRELAVVELVEAH